MQTITQYKCEGCKTRYTDRQEALDCEATHKPSSDFSIIDVRNFEPKKKYPKEIRIIDNENNIAVFIRK